MIYGNYTYNSTILCPESTLGDNQENNVESGTKLLHLLFGTSAEYANLLYSDNYQSKIPLISHHIWLTNPKSPREVKLKDLNNLNNTISTLDSQSNNKWTHIFWTNCKTCIPKTLEFLSNINIQVNLLSHYQHDLTSYQLVEDLIIEDNAFGMAADLIREDIVVNYGGLYLDLNYEVNRSPENLMERFNFILDEKVENYMFAASPQEPVLKLILKNTINKIKSLSTIGEKVQGCSVEELTDSITYGIFADTIAEYIPSLNRTFIIINNHEQEDISEGYQDSFEGINSRIKCIDRRTKDDPRIDIKEHPTCDKDEEVTKNMIKFMKDFPWKCHESLPFGTDGKEARGWVVSDSDQSAPAEENILYSSENTIDSNISVVG